MSASAQVAWEGRVEFGSRGRRYYGMIQLMGPQEKLKKATNSSTKATHSPRTAPPAGRRGVVLTRIDGMNGRARPRIPSCEFKTRGAFTSRPVL